MHNVDLENTDEQFMARALELAREGVGLASPNPCVGAVVVDDAGRVIGEGTHTYAGRKHAEILALEQAGGRARGATLYLNLEPCCHTGRTGPCTDAVIAAGVRRVVAGMSDPNPQVAGKGFERLRAAGIEVRQGIGEADARKLNEGFANWIRTGRPLVTLKTAMTLDGKIAPPPKVQHGSAKASGTTMAVVAHAASQAMESGIGAQAANVAAEAISAEQEEIARRERGYITSKPARMHVQEMRHASDAIMVGVGTVFADDPLLTDRTGRARRRPLWRCVIDTRLRIPVDAKLVKTAKDDVVVFCAFADEDRKQELEKRGVRVVKVGHAGMVSRPSLNEVVEWLGQEQITSLMIEGGSLVNWAALAANVVDKLFLYYAPKILGGGVPFATGMGYNRMADAAHVTSLTLHRFGEDFAVEGYLRDPYA